MVRHHGESASAHMRVPRGPFSVLRVARLLDVIRHVRTAKEVLREGCGVRQPLLCIEPEVFEFVREATFLPVEIGVSAVGVGVEVTVYANKPALFGC